MKQSEGSPEMETPLLLPTDAEDVDADDSNIDEGGGEKSKQMKKQFWVIKCLYFLLAGSGAGIGKFLPVFFYKLGMSPMQIAELLTTTSISRFTSAIVWGQLADATGAYKQIVLYPALLSSVLVYCFVLDVFQDTMYLMFLLVFIFSFFCSSTGSLIDSITMLYIRECENASYGQQRLWAAVGWGTLSFLSGWLVDVTSINAIFVMFSVPTLMTVFVVMRYFKNPPRGKDESLEDDMNDKTKVADHEASSITKLVCNAPCLLLFSNLIITGALIAFVESFLFVYMADVYDASQTLMGLCVLVMTIFELPIFQYSNPLLRNLGIQALLTISQILYAVRVACYTLIPKDKPWMFLLLEPTHGLVFAGMWVASVELASRMSTAKTQGTMQALVTSIYYVIGVGIIGTNLAAYIISSHGGGEQGFHVLYRFGAVAMLTWSILWNSMCFLQQRCSANNENFMKIADSTDPKRKDDIEYDRLSVDSA